MLRLEIHGAVYTVVYEMPLARCCILSLLLVSPAHGVDRNGLLQQRVLGTAHGAGLLALPLVKGIAALVQRVHLRLVSACPAACWEISNLFSALVFVVVVLLDAVCQLAYDRDGI